MEISKHKVLVVEDIKIAQKVAMITLSSLGCEVDTADSGMQAIELLTKGIYDIVFIDLGLPDIDGLTVTETIRRIEGCSRHTVMIALTAHSANEDDISHKQNCLEVGIDDYIEKPLTRDLALSMLEKFCVNNTSIRKQLEYSTYHQ